MSYLGFHKKYLSFSLGIGSACALTFVVLTACTGQAKAKPNLVHKEPPKAGLVAKIGDEEITEEALIGTDKMDFFDLKKREYELKMERLKKLMEVKLIGAEAKKANMPLDKFIKEKVIGGVIKVSESKFKKFVEEKHIPESQINPQIKERIYVYLQSSEEQDKITSYLAGLTKRNPVEVYFDKPRMQVEVEVGSAPAYGKQGAPITIIEFSDFQCPFCSRAADTVTQLKKSEYGSKIRFAFKQFPLPMHAEAKPAAEASLCVNEQSADKFWKFHDLAFKNQSKLDKASLEKYAKESGADLAKFNECVNSKKFAEAVQKDLEYGEKIGVKSTPTFFVNGQIVSGAVPMEQFYEIIKEELEKK